MKATVTIKFINANTGQEDTSKRRVISNSLSPRFYNIIRYVGNFTSYAPPFLGDLNVYAVTQPTFESHPYILNQGNVTAVSINRPLVTYNEIVPGSPDVFIFRARIGFNVSTNTYHAFGLTDNASINPASFFTVQSFSSLKVTPACTQGINEILDIDYQIQLDDSTFEPFSPYVQDNHSIISIANDQPAANFNNICWGSPFKASTDPLLNSPHPFDTGVAPLNDIDQSRYIAGTVGVGADDWTSYINDYQSGESYLQKVSDRLDYLGTVLRSWYIGDINFLTGEDIRFPISRGFTYVDVNEPFGNIYSHSALSNEPFHDADFLGGGTAYFDLSGTPTSSEFPDYYRFDVAVGGAIGVATYYWGRRRFLGFAGNTWTNIFANNPWLCNSTAGFEINTQVYNNFHGKVSSVDESLVRNNIIPVSETEVIHYDSTGLTLLNVIDGGITNFDVGTLPSFIITDIRQALVIGRTLYVATPEGLWSTDIDTPSISNLNSDDCYGVCESHSNRILALFSPSGTTRISESADWTLAVTGFNTGGATGWDDTGMVGIEADITQAQDEVCIVTDNKGSGSRGRFYWWDSGTGNVLDGPDNQTDFVKHVSQVQNNNGNWWFTTLALAGGGYPDRLFTASFGATVITLLGLSTDFTSSSSSYQGRRPWGNSPLFNEDGFLLGRRRVVAFDGTNRCDSDLDPATLSDNNSDFWGRCVYLGRGVIYSQHFIGCPYQNFLSTNYAIAASTVSPNPIVWDRYEWSGSSWDKITPTWNGTQWDWGTPAARATHSTIETLIDGLSVQNLDFDIPSGTKFVAGDWHNQTVAYGIVLDGDRTVTLSHAYCFKVAKQVSLSGTVPATAPYTVAIAESKFGGISRDLEWGAMLRFPSSAATQIINLDAIEVTSYRDDLDETLSLPAPGEVFINYQTGYLTFNSADAGKSLTGTITYATPGYDVGPAENYQSGAGIIYPNCIGYWDDTSMSASTWSDQSGNGNDFTSPGGSEPTLLVADINGLPALSFTTAGGTLMESSVTISDWIETGLTFIAVLDPSSWAGQEIWINFGDNSADSSDYNAFSILGESNRIEMQYKATNDFSYSNFYNGNVINSVLPSGSYNVVVVKLRPYHVAPAESFNQFRHKVEVWVDGVLFQSSDFIPSLPPIGWDKGNYTTSYIRIGAEDDLKNSHGDVKFAAMYLFKCWLAPTEHKYFEDLLKTKYAL